MVTVQNGAKMVKKIECDYIDGKINGHGTEWRENGQIREECYYVNGKKKWGLCRIV